LDKVIGIFFVVLGWVVMLFAPTFMVVLHEDPWLLFLYFVSWIPGAILFFTGFFIMGIRKEDKK
jgi:hypothetical protein